MLFYYSCQTLQLSCMNSIITVFFKLSRILLPSLRGGGSRSKSGKGERL